MAGERRRIAETFQTEIAENFDRLARNSPLSCKVFETAKGTDQLKLLDNELARQIMRTYDKVTTINDALIKFQSFTEKSGCGPEVEKKNGEFEQFLQWYRSDLRSALEILNESLKKMTAAEALV